MTAETIAKALGGHRAGATWMAGCPAHDDSSPSLAISAGRHGKMLVRYQQDATAAHELNQDMRNSDEFTKVGIKKDLWKVGHLSEVDCLKMMTEDGFDPYRAKASEIIAFLRKHKDKWGHVLTTRGRF
jgi:hypothetical protein